MVVSLCQKSPIAIAWEGPTHQGNSCTFRNITAPTACFEEGVQGRDVLVGQLRAQENLAVDDEEETQARMLVSLLRESARANAALACSALTPQH